MEYIRMDFIDSCFTISGDIIDSLFYYYFRASDFGILVYF